MRNLIIVLGMLTGVNILFSCSNANEATNQVILMVDNTEKTTGKQSMISENGLLALVGNNGSITWKQLNAVSLNRDTTIQMSLPEDATSLQIKNQIDPFKASIEVLRKRYLGPVNTESEASNLYKPICEAVENLSVSRADINTLVIVSDMIENSAFGNFYKSQDLKKVKESLKTSGDSLVHNPKNLKVVILYNPEGSTKKQAQFDGAIKIWDVLFKEAGISYEIKANL